MTNAATDRTRSEVLRRGSVDLQQNLADIQERIARACDRVGRDPASVTLVAVTKTFPLHLVQEAYDVGLRHFGENKPQELQAKFEGLPGRQAGGDATWHMIGHVQRNKAKDVVACADRVHAVDSLRLAKELDRRAQAAGRTVPCMVQLNVSGESAKFGIEPVDAPVFMAEAMRFKNLLFDGFMSLASPTDDPETVRPEFRSLRETMERLRQSDDRFSSLTNLSMGMSGDYEIAIEEGATHVRIGSALFGARD